MDANYVRSYLVANGKYFPSSKLVALGCILEESNRSEHVINKRFFSPVFITVIFWVFWPFQLFDRLILKDWFWGWFKLLLPIIVGFILYKSSRSPFQLKNNILEVYNIVELVGTLAIIFWALWTIVDGFTIYGRTKKANYRAVLGALNIRDGDYVIRTPRKPKISSKVDKSNEKFLEWRKANPHLSINDFYKKR